MPNNRHCIICDARKPESLFEKKGEHIVPRSLGNRKLRTPHVCKECNGGLGGSVDVALKNVYGVTLACYDRDVGGVRSGRTKNCVNDIGADIIIDLDKLTHHHYRHDNNPDVKGAVLKIAYEAAHLHLGNDYLRDPVASVIRKILFAYVNKDKDIARKYATEIQVRDISVDIFYYTIRQPRGELLRRAVTSKSCLNALWLMPIVVDSTPPRLAMICDIEGLPLKCAVIGKSNYEIAEPILLWPR